MDIMLRRVNIQLQQLIMYNLIAVALRKNQFLREYSFILKKSAAAGEQILKNFIEL
jgi:hypothetical protein